MAYAPFWLKVLYHYLGLTHQASVRRGPRASATSLFTVSLAESEASAFLANRVCVSPNQVKHGLISEYLCQQLKSPTPIIGTA